MTSRYSAAIQCHRMEALAQLPPPVMFLKAMPFDMPVVTDYLDAKFEEFKQLIVAKFSEFKKETKDAVKEVVKEAVQEAVEEAVQKAVEEQGAGAKKRKTSNKNEDENDTPLLEAIKGGEVDRVQTLLVHLQQVARVGK